MKYLITLAFIATSFVGISQEITDFEWFNNDYEDELYLGIGVSGATITNSEAPNPDEHKISALLFRIDMRSINFDKGGVKIYYENKLLGDIISFASDVVSGKGDIYQTESSGLSTGLLGWWSFLFNLTEPGKYQISAGLNLNDFFLTSAYPEDVTKPYNNISNNIVQEPNGYYFGLGPAATFTYYLSSLAMLEYHTALSIPYYRFESENFVESPRKYKSPYFLNQKIELITSKGLFGGLELSNIINRGNLPNNTIRKEWYVGFRIML